MLLGSALIKGSIIRQKWSCEAVSIEIYALPVVPLELAKLELTKLGREG